MNARYGWMTLVAFCGATPLLAQQVPDVALARNIAAYVAPFEARELSGTLLVARGSRIVFEKSFGYADYEHGVKFSGRTPAVIASVSKPLTIIIASALVDQNRLSLNDTVSRWLPEYVHGGKMTVGQLMAHQAGVPHRLLPEEQQTEPRTAAEMVLIANKLDLLFAPGAQRTYSSGGYAILAAVLERAGGASYEELLQKYVAQPAGARTLHHASARDVVPGRARSFMKAEDLVVNTPLRDVSFLVGGGSNLATPADLLAVMRALVRGAYGETARARLVTNTGFAWNGVTNGYRSFADYRSSDSLSVIFVGNAHTGAIDLLRREIPRMAAGEAASPYTIPAHPAKALSEAVRRRLEGNYDTGGRAIARLTFISPSTVIFGDRILTAVNDTTLFSYADYAFINFESAADGKISALQWGTGTWGAPNTPGPRFPRVD
jgi:CubicO group peptidase (beta-lactamase class C family)